jgi:hypothetical protein
MKWRSFILIWFIFSINSVYAGKNWTLELDKEGIKVYTRTSESSSFKEFKAETLIKATTPEIEKVLTDIERYPEWCYKTTSATVFERDSVTIRYFYVSKTPSFLKTRVACFEFHREINNQTGEVIFYLNDIPCKQKLSEDMLLIPIMKGYYRLTPAGKNEVLVTMQMQTEPGGIIPSWLANLVVVDSPYITLKGLATQIKKNLNK